MCLGVGRRAGLLSMCVYIESYILTVEILKCSQKVSYNNNKTVPVYGFHGT